MAAITNTLNLEQSIRDEYNAQLSQESQSDGFQLSSFPTYDKFRAQRLKEFGLSPSVDATKYTENVSSDGKQRSWNIVDPNGNKVLDKNWTDDWSLLKDFVIPGAAFVGTIAAGGIGAANALGAAGAGAAGTGGAAAGAAGAGAGAAGAGVGAAGAGAGLGGTGGLLGAAGAGVADATLPTVFISGTSAGAGGLAGLSASQVAALGAAGAGAAGGLGGASGGSANSGLSSSDKAALYSPEGYGPGMTGSQTSLYDTVLGATGSPQLAGTVANSSIGSGLSSLASGLGGWGNLASVAGGLLGSTQPTSASSSVSSKIDPRMAAYLYGNGYGDANSLLGAAQQLYAQNKSGLNSTMQQGLDMQKAALLDSAYGQAYSSMRSLGTGLLGAGVAGNPFTSGGVAVPQVSAPQATTPQASSAQTYPYQMAPSERNMMFMGPGVQALGSGLLPGTASAQNYINGGRGLLSTMKAM